MKKTEERKENETNALRAWTEHVSERLQGRTLYLVVGSLVLVVVGILIFRYWRISQVNANSARWLELYSTDTDKGLQSMVAAPANQGKPQTVNARLQLARLALYPEGIQKLASFTAADRATAIEKVEEGRKRYEEILSELTKESALLQEAYFSLARAEECLMGRPKKDNSTEMRGSIDRAIELWRKAASIRPDSEPSKRYIAHADMLKSKKAEISQFYTRLTELDFTPALPKDDFHGFGPVP